MLCIPTGIGVVDSSLLLSKGLLRSRTKKDIVEELNPKQLKELDKAIEEADNKETISWDDFKKEMKEWRKK